MNKTFSLQNCGPIHAENENITEKLFFFFTSYAIENVNFFSLYTFFTVQFMVYTATVTNSYP